MEIDPRQADIAEKERKRKQEQGQRAVVNIKFCAAMQEWPPHEEAMVKMMLGLIPSPEPKRKNREH